MDHRPQHQTFGRQVTIQGVDIDDPDVVANTVIAGVLFFGGGEIAGCTVAGLTVSDGGVICSGSSPTIRNCLITENSSWDWDLGGAITLWGAALPSLSQMLHGACPEGSRTGSA